MTSHRYTEVLVAALRRGRRRRSAAAPVAANLTDQWAALVRAGRDRR